MKFLVLSVWTNFISMIKMAIVTTVTLMTVRFVIRKQHAHNAKKGTIFQIWEMAAASLAMKAVKSVLEEQKCNAANANTQPHSLPLGLVWFVMTNVKPVNLMIPPSVSPAGILILSMQMKEEIASDAVKGFVKGAPQQIALNVWSARKVLF